MDPNVPEVPPVTHQSNHTPITIIILSVLLFFSLVLSTFLAVKLVSLPKANPVSTPVTQIPSATSAPNPTADWKSYQNSAGKYSFRYPSTYALTSYTEGSYTGVKLLRFGDNQIKSESALVDGIMIKTLLISPSGSSLKDLAEKTRKSEGSPDFTNPVSELTSVIISAKNAYTYEVSGQGKTVVYFIDLGDKILRVSGSLQGNSQSIDGWYLTEFNQILSTFKFTDSVSTPTAKPINPISYNLPTGWKTTVDSSGLFSVGYNPATQDVVKENAILKIVTKNLQNNPYYAPYSVTQSFSLLPYDNGSRHAFIESQLGEPVSNANKATSYYESEFSIAGHSCLVLNGISISQFPSVWGMCVINSKQALLFTTFNYADLSQHLSTLKFL